MKILSTLILLLMLTNCAGGNIAKVKFDPKGLLNPGKLEGWEIKEQFNI